MLEKDWHKDAVLLYVVVNEKMASKVIAEAKTQGIRGATVMLGRGTVNNRWLNAIGVVDSRKEVVIMGADTPTARQAMEAISKRFHFEKPNRGIAFAVAMQGIVGTDAGKAWPSVEDVGGSKGESGEAGMAGTVAGAETAGTAGTAGNKDAADEAGTGAKWQLLTTIVDRGRSEDVVEAAQSAGSRGGTVIAGRGSGVAQTELVLGMEIEPEKDIVFMLTPGEMSGRIEEAIADRLDLEKPNTGILFVQNVVAVSGLYQGE
ncbi:MAG: transcriptional regulator [Mobiluncus porci]|uniref:Transcriptional regulator n=1 Tax=Mobiluncus porci TaxID=2652278 RepID=A0A7K0K547_9ACTO|nr:MULTISPECIES: P-II family nitrogen regulator [Mobiluncus]MCI6585151.1 transcriptional regulator [Mobiluncus sp.]MDD7541749.1 transcriptional regulator [Mobiluncus porci]MDY5747997.1 transcriptional regulator [Mobiluncus porci]MST50558.1 transcriptional regulator [Mobiluncus porci]